jgi:hypothetical protein
MGAGEQGSGAVARPHWIAVPPALRIPFAPAALRAHNRASAAAVPSDGAAAEGSGRNNGAKSEDCYHGQLAYWLKHQLGRDGDR